MYFRTSRLVSLEGSASPPILRDRSEPIPICSMPFVGVVGSVEVAQKGLLGGGTSTSNARGWNNKTVAGGDYNSSDC